MRSTFHFRFMWPLGLGFFVDRPYRDLDVDETAEVTAVSWKLALGPFFFAGTVFIGGRGHE